MNERQIEQWKRSRNNHVTHVYNQITQAVEAYQNLNQELYFDTGALNQFLKDEFDPTHRQLPLLMESCEDLEDYASFLRKYIGRDLHISFTKVVGPDNQLQTQFLLHIDITPQKEVWSWWSLLKILTKNWPPLFFGILVIYFLVSKYFE